MKELSRFELAIVKRTAQNTKSLRVRRNKLIAQIEKAQEEVDVLSNAIDGFEAPIRTMTGGLSSEEVLEGLEVAETVDVNEVDAEEAPTLLAVETEVEVEAVEEDASKSWSEIR